MQEEGFLFSVGCTRDYDLFIINSKLQTSSSIAYKPRSLLLRLLHTVLNYLLSSLYNTTRSGRLMNQPIHHRNVFYLILIISGKDTRSSGSELLKSLCKFYYQSAAAAARTEPGVLFAKNTSQPVSQRRLHHH